MRPLITAIGSGLDLLETASVFVCDRVSLFGVPLLALFAMFTPFACHSL